MRPALASVVPSSASRVRKASVPGWSGLPSTSSVRPRSGSRPSFQRPASALASLMAMRAGWSSPVLFASARPERAVAGAALLKADRSSAVVRSCTSPSGQRANGLTPARASSAWAGRCADGWARTVACSSGSASGPASVACALQAGSTVAVAAGAAGVSCASETATSSVIGAALAMRAVPLPRSRSQANDSCSMRCSAPAFAPRCTRARRSRSGNSPRVERCNSPTRNERRSSSTGSCRSAGRASASVLVDGASVTSTRRACRSSSVTRHQRGAAARAMRRPRQPAASSTTRPPPPGSRIDTRCASKSPSSAPFGAVMSTPGKADSSQALPRSLPTAHPHVAARAMSSVINVAAVPTNACHHHPRCRGTSPCGAVGGAAAGSALAGICSAIRTRSRC